MAPTLYRDTGYALSHLIGDIEHGKLALPDIQRPFVWSAAKIRDLFDSMYRGYPVGTLVFWETGAEVGTRQIGDADGAVPRLLIVDGQQRLTSLYAVITGTPVMTKTYQSKLVRIAFRPTDELFEVTDAAIERDPEFIPDITELWRGKHKSVLREFDARLSESRDEPLTREEEDLLEDRIDAVRDLKDFRFQVIELSMEANEEQVAEIFVRINSEGVQLNQADFILTLMSVHWEKGRLELEQFCQASVDPQQAGPSPRNPYIDPGPDQLLRAGVGLAFRRGRLQHVYSILRGKDLDTGQVSPERRLEQFERLRVAQDDVLDLNNWHEYLKCLAHAGFRSKRMITSENALIYTYILWLIGKRDFALDLRTLRGVIGRWFFMAQTTRRYTSSPESQIESDLGRIGALADRDGEAFCAELERIVRSNFTNDYWEISLPNQLDTSSSRSPVLYAYWAALNLLDAELLFSDVRVRDLLDPAVSAPRSIERHHLFPKKHLERLGVTTTRQVNAIANMAFLDWPENAEISADGPIDYWPAMKALVTEDRLSQHVFWHALPMGWEQLEYPEFLEKRRDLIARVVRDGFNKLCDDGPPDEPGSLADLIALGESQTLEFKSTARWNIRAEKHDKKMEHVITKTVCAYLNSEGGTLLIGIDDDGVALGLDADMATLGNRGNHDGFELWLRQHLEANLSGPTAGTVSVGFETMGDKDVCVVNVASAGRPVFAKPLEGSGGPSEFWVRVGNASNQLHGDDMVEYQSDRWG